MLLLIPVSRSIPDRFFCYLLLRSVHSSAITPSMSTATSHSCTAVSCVSAPNDAALAALQDKCGQVFALLLNRLSANVLPDTWRPAGWQGRRTTVRLAAGASEIATPGGLLRALCGESGADVYMQTVSRVTGFSRGMAPQRSLSTCACVAYRVPVLVARWNCGTGVMWQVCHESLACSRIVGSWTHRRPASRTVVRVIGGCYGEGRMC